MPTERAARRFFCRRRRQAVAAGNQKGGTAAKHRRKAEISRGAQKDLIRLVRSRHCGELNRGLENLERSRKGNGLVLFAACKKYRKNTPRVATLWTPGDDSNLRSIHGFRRNDRRSSCNRPRRVFLPFRVSPVRI